MNVLVLLFLLLRWCTVNHGGLFLTGACAPPSPRLLYLDRPPLCLLVSFHPIYL